MPHRAVPVAQEIVRARRSFGLGNRIMAIDIDRIGVARNRLVAPISLGGGPACPGVALTATP